MNSSVPVVFCIIFLNGLTESVAKRRCDIYNLLFRQWITGMGLVLRGTYVVNKQIKMKLIQDSFSISICLVMPLKICRTFAFHNN